MSASTRTVRQRVRRLNTDRRREAYECLERAKRLESYAPEHAAELREEAAALVDVDGDDVGPEALAVSLATHLEDVETPGVTPAYRFESLEQAYGAETMRDSEAREEELHLLDVRIEALESRVPEHAAELKRQREALAAVDGGER